MMRAATFPEVTPFSSGVSSLGELRRVVVRHACLGLGALVAVGVTGAAVTAAAVWIVAGALSTHSSFRAKAPLGLETIALANPQRTRIDTARLAAAYALDLARETEPARTAAATAAPKSVAPPRPDRVTEHTGSITLPPPAPSNSTHSPARHEIAAAPGGRAASQVAAIAPLPPMLSAPKSSASQQAHNNAASLPDPDSRTAIYDIEAHTVYLPGGERLEAHSGIGPRMDDPKFAGQKNRGPTPPNVYDLTMREEIFHGVRAIRLNPIDDGKMFGRDGMLAHTYMLGPTGQSFGCVSFKDYPAFLRAFQKGEVARLVVVPHLGNAPAPALISRRRHFHRYASND
jgi:hypothetical protein